MWSIISISAGWSGFRADSPVSTNSLGGSSRRALRLCDDSLRAAWGSRTLRLACPSRPVPWWTRAGRSPLGRRCRGVPRPPLRVRTSLRYRPRVGSRGVGSLGAVEFGDGAEDVVEERRAGCLGGRGGGGGGAVFRVHEDHIGDSVDMELFEDGVVGEGGTCQPADVGDQAGVYVVFLGEPHQRGRPGAGELQTGHASGLEKADGVKAVCADAYVVTSSWGWGSSEGVAGSALRA